MESKEWKGSNGKFIIEKNSNFGLKTTYNIVIKGEFAKINCHNKNDANLFLDAINTIQIENTMPSELLKERNELKEQRDELLDKCEKALDYMDEYGQTAIELKELIKKIKG